MILRLRKRRQPARRPKQPQARVLRRRVVQGSPTWRVHMLLSLVLLGFIGLAWQVVDLQLKQQRLLQSEGQARHVRVLTVPAERGRIFDRNGQILSNSTPVYALTADPRTFCPERERWPALEKMLDITTKALDKTCERQAGGHFMFIRRQVVPQIAEAALALDLPGLALQREYRRYYPNSPIGAHLLGFTNIDGVGQEGIELYFDRHLKGASGRQRVLKDLRGRAVELVELVEPMRPGRDLELSIDQRVQALASTYLEEAVRRHEAKSGSVIVLGVPSGELLASVSLPRFNPNNRNSITPDNLRNRVLTDPIEPGSIVKPLVVAAAIESGAFELASVFDTHPGRIKIGGHTVSDTHDYGELSLAEVLIKSSNVGTAQLALELPFETMAEVFERAGLGEAALDLPGEYRGEIPHRERPIERASFAYGYGVSASALQLARAYTVFATDGRLLDLTLEKQPIGHRAAGRRVLRPDTVRAMRPVLEAAASSEGTASRAPVPRYRIGGKTGTTHKLIDGRYDRERYRASFVGIAPLEDPRFVILVLVDDPRGKRYYGGDVAAPVFSALAADLMRLNNIPPARGI